MLAIRWAQGRLPELWPEIQDHGERFPWIPRWRDALAAAELGDEEAARRELERHAVRGFAELPRDGNWIVHVCSLADACVLVGDERRGLQLYELLLPHEGDNAVTYSKQPFGPVALRLGKLAALLERWEDADRHFATALERCELLCARAIRARVLLEHAQALAARGEGGDRERIAAMLEEAAASLRRARYDRSLRALLGPRAGIRCSRRPWMRSSGTRGSSGRSPTRGRCSAFAT